MGPPSNTVATEEGVPGIFNKIAEINPPDVPPTSMAINIAIPLRGLIEKVKGRQSATPIVEVKPGIAPKIIPSTTPKNIIPIVCTFKTDVNPSITIKYSF